ncbi:MAG: EI24 domain-containing protein [Sphingomonadales bacterium]|nr:EI24 domain-containing protein [Sphingomonadales bacterium]
MRSAQKGKWLACVIHLHYLGEMLTAISRGFASLADNRIMLILAKVISLTLAAFLILGIALWYAVDFAFGYFGVADDGTLSALAAVAILAISGLVLFRMVAIAITWVFSDDIIDAVEERHYPFEAARGKRPSNMTSLRMGLRSARRALGYNLLALPLYLLLLVTGIGAPLVFIAVNALLLGRDLEDMLVARHGHELAAFGKGERLMLGAAGAAGMMVPLLQFVVPVVATAAAVHMAHGKFRVKTK